MRSVRTLMVHVLIDAVVVCVAVGLAYIIRFEGAPPDPYRGQLVLVLPYLVPLRLLLLGSFRVYRRSWRQITVGDLPRIVGAMATASTVLVAARFLAIPLPGPGGLVINTPQAPVLWGVLVTELALSTMGVVGVRALWRLTAERLARTGKARVVELAETTSMKVRIIPQPGQVLSDVVIEDLLRREPVDLDEQLIRQFITGKIVLVTGAGGSIGSEICRQVCRFAPRRLILVDQAENPLFHIQRELQDSVPDTGLVARVGNVADGDRMRQVLGEVRPEVIFHAAAHKHVPLMEANPGEAIRNNVGGSRVMADLAHEFGVDAFVMISTDKAVNPTSVMGATKRLAEIYVQALAAGSTTRFITVRFGNVLGSQGSVVPLFQQDIARGGPVRVTHPEMKRYFMTIPEAGQLVLQSAAMGKGGEIFVLEMGEPIPIVDLARALIPPSGSHPDRQIDIVFTGIRPGEKLSEEMNLSEENATKTRHPRIWIGNSSETDPGRTAAAIDGLLEAVNRSEPEALRRRLRSIVPEYRPATHRDEGPESSNGASRARVGGRGER